MEAGKLYLNSHSDSALLYLNQALKRAEEAGFERGIVRCRINKAFVVYNTGQLDTAFALCKSVIPLCEKLGMDKEKVAAYNTMGNAWNDKGNHWLAIEYYSKSMEAMKNVTLPPHFPIVVRNNIAILYLNLHLYEKVLEYGQKNYEAALEIEDEESAGIASEHIGNAYLGLQKEEEAIHWFKKAVALARKSGHQRLLSSSLSILADLHMKNNDLSAAKKMYDEAYHAAVQNDDKQNIMQCLHGYSLLHFEEKDFTKAEEFAQKSLKIAEELGIDDYKQAIYLTLSDIALATKDLKKYQDYRERYFTIRDTLANTALVHALQDLETKYETERKELEIKKLQQELELDRLKIQRKNSLIAALVTVAIFLFLLGWLLLNNARNRKKLLEQENELQKQQIIQLEQEKQLTSMDAMLQGQEKERGRLARDLHDGLGGMLSGIKQSLFAMKGKQILSENAAVAFNQVIDDMDRSISELRNIARNMMPEALVRFGLKDALQDYCDHLQQAAGIPLHFQAYGMEKRLPEHMEVILFRVAQELLNNVVKHANANKIIVQLLQDVDRFSMTIEDDGNGFDPAKLETAPGVGWLNIRSRISYLNGSLDLQTATGKGTSVHIECPIKDAE